MATNVAFRPVCASTWLRPRSERSPSAGLLMVRWVDSQSTWSVKKISIFGLWSQPASQLDFPHVAAAARIVILAGVHHAVGCDGHVVHLPAGLCAIHHGSDQLILLAVRVETNDLALAGAAGDPVSLPIGCQPHRRQPAGPAGDRGAEISALAGVCVYAVERAIAAAGIQAAGAQVEQALDLGVAVAAVGIGQAPVEILNAARARVVPGQAMAVDARHVLPGARGMPAAPDAAFVVQLHVLALGHDHPATDGAEVFGFACGQV